MSSEVPEGWREASFSDLARYDNGRAFKPTDWGNEGLPIVRIAQITNPDAETNRYLGEVEDRHRLNDGDLIFSWSATLAVMKWRRGPAVLNQHLFKVTPAAGIDQDWLQFRLEASIPDLTEEAHGTTMKHIRKGTLSSQTTLVPPLDEQRRIAEVLRSEEEAIGMTEQAIGQSRVLKAALLRELFTKGVGHSDFKETRLGLLPSKWDVRPLGSCFENLDSQRRPVKKEERAQMRGAIPYYGASGIIDWVSDHLFDEPLLLLAEDGANLISKSTPIAFISTGKSWVNNHAHVYRPTTALDIALAEEWLSFTDISPFITGSAQPKLNKDRADAILMPIPPVEEQAMMKEIFCAVNQTIAEELSKLRMLRDVKLNLADDLLSGRVRVPA